jgi:hypothetical protein
MVQKDTPGNMSSEIPLVATRCGGRIKYHRRVKKAEVWIINESDQFFFFNQEIFSFHC